MTDVEHKPLRLLAQDMEDIAVVGSLLQDALVPLRDISYQPADRQLLMVVNRFCWEDAKGADDNGPFYRTHTGVRIDNVARVSYRGVNRKDPDQVHELLTVVCDDSGDDGAVLALHFSGSGVIRIEVDSVYCGLEDLGAPWPTPWRPDHSA